MSKYSFVFRNALLLDGSGEKSRIADVAVRDGLIAAVAPRIADPAEQSFDATGLALAPGFIDIHSHSDATVFRNPLAPSKLLQGVTTEVTGNCGLGMFPVGNDGGRELTDYLRVHDFVLPEGGLEWCNFGEYADRIDGLHPVLNSAPLTGHAPLRIAAMGTEERQPSPAEMALMRHLLVDSLRQGSWGLSTGLIYPPGSYAETAELVELARTTAEEGGIYGSHIRGEGETLITALDEAIAIGRESGARIQVSHLKAMGRGNRGRAREILEKLAAARAAGIDISADQYPYAASATTLTAVLPHWAHAGGIGALLERLRSPGPRERICREIEREMAAREGADGITVGNCRSEGNRHLSGRTIAAIAAGWGCSPGMAVMRLISEEEGRVGAIFFSMAAEDVETILADPDTAVGSDGHALDAVSDGDEATHPRSYGTFSRILGEFVRERGILGLATAIRKMTSLPAERLGLCDRGLIRPGFAADLVLFDPATVADNATYAEPHQYATGIVHLLVNGRQVISHGEVTGVRPGKVLRRPLRRAGRS